MAEQVPDGGHRAVGVASSGTAPPFQAVDPRGRPWPLVAGPAARAGAGAGGTSVTCWPPRGDPAGNRRVQPMITVAGEALIDLIVDPAGHVDPRLGGGPFNVARAVARLGLPAAFLGRLSGDRFGQLMRADLDRHGVLVAVGGPRRRADHAGAGGRGRGRRARLPLLPGRHVGGRDRSRRGGTARGHHGPAHRQPRPGHGAGGDQYRTAGGRAARRHHGHARPELPPGRHRFPAGLPGPAEADLAPGGHGQDEHRGSRLPVPRPGRRARRRGTARPGPRLRGGHRRRGRGARLHGRLPDPG